MNLNSAPGWLLRVATLLLVILLTNTAFAAGKPFDAAQFEAAQKAGRPILVAVHADWCVTCRAQEPVIEAALHDPKNANFVVFRVDFDRQQDLLRRFNVQYQSTLIVYKGATEVTRSVAAVGREAIAAQLAKAQ